MLERPPNLLDTDIIAALREDFGLPVIQVRFLPVGNDAGAWVFQVQTFQENYFLKVRRLPVSIASLQLSWHLFDQGIHEVVAPIPTRHETLLQELGSYGLILYPFITGANAMETGLTPRQWIHFGEILRMIHSTRLTGSLVSLIGRENFQPHWAPMVKTVAQRIVEGNFTDEYQANLAPFWEERSAEITSITARCEKLGQWLRERNLPQVVCHADIHTANLLVDPNGGLHIVDWDGILLAPKERDLMFVAGKPSAPIDGGAEERLFFQGYGKTTIDPLALAYYRYEWVVQELGDYGARVFIQNDNKDVTRADSVGGLKALFDPGDVVAEAYQMDEFLSRKGSF